MTPVFTRAPTITNNPAKNSRVSHSTRATGILLRHTGDQHQHAGAEQRDDRGLDVDHGVGDEGGEAPPPGPGRT